MRGWLLPLFASCSAEIGQGMDADSADRMMATLSRAGVHAQKEAGPAGFSVRVAGGDAARALEVVRAGRPPEAGEAVFASESLIPTAAEERASYERAVAGDVARSLETMDGVLSARVHLALPARDPFASDAPPPRPRASVLVRTQAEGPEPSHADVRALVAGAVDGLRDEDVSVVVDRAARPPVPARGRVVPASWLAAGSVLVAALAVAVLGAIAHARGLRQKLRTRLQQGRPA